VSDHSIPAPRPSFIAYAIVDVATTPPTPVGVKMSRSDARTEVNESPFRDTLRIRRARVQLYQS
jgi:hypothetical protein